jgi:hypothetical protein
MRLVKTRRPVISGAAVLLLAAAPVAAQSTGLVPLTEMGPSTYLGLSGGLYPDGNLPPSAHAAEGLSRALAIEPLDTSGSPSPTGRIALVSIGMSNTTQEFCSAGGQTPCAAWSFVGQALADPEVNHTTLALVNGARGGQTAMSWDDPADPNYDRVRDVDLAEQGLTEAQVQVAWVKVANSMPNVSLPSANADAYVLEGSIGSIARALEVRYPNIRLVFLTSRIYAGWATTTLNPEPYAYESGFSVKWAIQAQIDQAAGGGVDPQTGDLDYSTVAPWLGWAAYLWGDGLDPRCDGLVWEQADFSSDGTHPSQSGESKVGALLLEFFKGDPRTRPWFLALGDTAITPSSADAAGGSSVAISGVGFQDGAAVTIGGLDATATVGSPTSITATTPPLPAGALHDVVVTNTDLTAGTISRGFFADFADVPQAHAFHVFVESIVRSAVTAGCGDGIYCPDDPVTRAQMAAFLLKGRYGACYEPPGASGTVFADVPSDHPFAAWIEDLATLGVTAGCGGDSYCPGDAVTRAQMAVFLLKTLVGAAYAPPAAAGVFGDVPATDQFASWVEDLYARGITGGCSASPLLYCPSDPNTRGQMAVFLVRTFGL